jgi:hypothetical protein
LLRLKTKCIGRLSAVLALISASLTASSYIFSVNSGHCWMLKKEPVSLKFRRAAVRAMIASPIQKSTKKPVKFAYSLVGSKYDTRDSYSIVGKMRRRFCWRSSLRTSEVVLTEGGASSGGAGVLRPLSGVSCSSRRDSRTCSLIHTWRVLRHRAPRHLEQKLSQPQRL